MGPIHQSSTSTPMFPADKTGAYPPAHRVRPCSVASVMIPIYFEPSCVWCNRLLGFFWETQIVYIGCGVFSKNGDIEVTIVYIYIFLIYPYMKYMYRKQMNWLISNELVSFHQGGFKKSGLQETECGHDSMDFYRQVDSYVLEKIATVPRFFFLESFKP